MTNRIIDTHIHMWNLEKAEYTWLKGDTSILNKTYLIEQLTPQIEKAGVTDGVLVQAANNFEDTDLMMQVAAETEWIKGVVSWLPLQNPKATEKALTERFCGNHYLKGCRHLIHNEPNPKWLLQTNVIESLEILAEHQLTYDIVGINIEHIKTAITVAEKLPNLKMVFDHLNQPPIARKEKHVEWERQMTIASEHPNLYAKISGLSVTAGNGKNWTKDDLKPYIMQVLKLFGTNRCFCGGDWPVALLAGPYEKAWLTYREIFSEELTADDQVQVLYNNAASFYKLTP
ncbi:amidohydrolase family protein [Inquilinus sp. KBS0705]|nr:amidohydrolase family protein [Inquilinus sp. KBS0705]